MLSLYNSLTRTKELIPNDRTVNLYSCGPTVYNYAHIGNLRSFISADILYRTLKADGYAVNWVMNITDVDDKTIKATIAEKGNGAATDDLKRFTRRYFDLFKNDLQKVGASVNDIAFVNVTDVIPTIIELIKKLLAQGFAYRADDGSTYFSIQKYEESFHDYGALMGEKFMEGKKINARIANDEYHKDDLSDFALWKAHTPDDGQIFWDDLELGKGRPGWHIECSAVNWREFNGATTTIHTGGVDLRFPHHTNEIAQSAPLYAPEPFVRHWFHSEHLLVDGKKMSKSLGNFYTLRDLEEKGFSGLDLRYAVLGAHYRTQQNFSLKSLEASKVSLERLYEAAWKLKRVTGDKSISATSNWQESVLDDLNTSQGLAALHTLLSSDYLESKFSYKKLLDIDSVLGLAIAKGAEDFDTFNARVTGNISDEAANLVTARNTARTTKNWAESDRLRAELETLGYIVKDTPEGTKIEKKLDH